MHSRARTHNSAARSRCVPHRDRRRLFTTALHLPLLLRLRLLRRSQPRRTCRVPRRFRNGRRRRYPKPTRQRGASRCSRFPTCSHLLRGQRRRPLRLRHGRLLHQPHSRIRVRHPVTNGRRRRRLHRSAVTASAPALRRSSRTPSHGRLLRAETGRRHRRPMPTDRRRGRLGRRPIRALRDRRNLPCAHRGRRRPCVRR